MNIAAISLQDFSLRMHEHHESEEYSTSPLSFYIELTCNIFFLIVFIIRVVAFGLLIGNRTYLQNRWNILAFIVLISTLINIFFNFL